MYVQNIKNTRIDCQFFEQTIGVISVVPLLDAQKTRYWLAAKESDRHDASDVGNRCQGFVEIINKTKPT